MFFVELWGIDFEPYIRGSISIILKIIVVIIVYSIVKPIGKRIIKSIIEKVGNRQKLSDGRKKTLEKLIHNIYTYILIFVLVITLLDIVGIPIGPILAGAGILGLAISFGAQGLVSDIVTGFFILMERQIDVDDYVVAGGLDGIVEEVGLRTTKLRGFDGTLHFIPNRNISNVTNHSRGNMRALVDIGISYNEDMDHVISVIQKACDAFATGDERIKEGPNVIGVQSFGASEVVLRIIAQTENGEQFGVERELRKAIKETLDQAGIEIPYPHQVMIQKTQA
ncbi:mechanosensitive ion channel family protein [Salirhabdus sp. Marseille-P4669]|uniref:mechanosensitive ion channel family protein n=1 Tax=Salirhabdus sp. Marseille-P4669 TaxID=2042310 RepID=UPI000C7A657C|nr:mechanosensitive ion channel family protein [Salirhabdus sp. Marseille-P4669]